MKNINTIKVNFKGGIIPPAELYNILVAAGKFGLLYTRFGLRQQLLLNVEIEELDNLTEELTALGVSFELGNDEYPNIVSSYLPKKYLFLIPGLMKVFINRSLLLSLIHQDSKSTSATATKALRQCLRAILIGWHRPTNRLLAFVYPFPQNQYCLWWKDIVHTDDLAAMSLSIEETILGDKAKFYENEQANGDELYSRVKTTGLISSLRLSP